MTGFLPLVFYLTVLIFSVMVHEISHGYAAEKLGDPTARLAGRLTLNPIRHIDPFGSIILPLIFVLTHSPIVLGWAKPVPYNPANLHKDYRYGPLKVALAGPLSNLLILVVFGLIARAGVYFLNPLLVGLFAFIAYLNVFLAIFNLIPIPPLDGSKILPLLLPPRYALAFERIGFSGILLILLFIFFFSDVVALLAGKLFLLVAGEGVYKAMIPVFYSLFS